MTGRMHYKVFFMWPRKKMMVKVGRDEPEKAISFGLTVDFILKATTVGLSVLRVDQT